MMKPEYTLGVRRCNLEVRDILSEVNCGHQQKCGVGLENRTSKLAPWLQVVLSRFEREREVSSLVLESPVRSGFWCLWGSNETRPVSPSFQTQNT